MADSGNKTCSLSFLVSKADGLFVDNSYDLTRYFITGPRSVVVSVLDCGSETLGFESHQSHVGGFQPWPAPTQSWECYGPSGKAGTTQLNFIHFADASLRVLL